MTERSLLEMKRGTQSQVLSLEGTDAVRLRLATLGIAPGTVVEVRQTWPAVVVRVDHSEFALERDIASAVRVAS